MDMTRWWRAEWPVFLLALQFLTRLPVTADYTPERLAATPRWYPAVGALVGAMVGIVWWGAALLLPPVVAVLIAVAAGLLITGALHEDGFADCCDGLGGGATPARALDIMRDSRLGTYGVLGLGLMLGVKVAVLAALPPVAVPLVLVVAHSASRASAVVVMAQLPYLRARGAGSGLERELDAYDWTVIGVTLTAVTLAVLSVVPLLAVVAGAAGLVGGHYAMRRRFAARLGGYTGDCLGAVQQCSEIGLLIGVLAAI